MGHGQDADHLYPGLVDAAGVGRAGGSIGRLEDEAKRVLGVDGKLLLAIGLQRMASFGSLHRHAARLSAASSTARQRLRFAAQALPKAGIISRSVEHSFFSCLVLKVMRKVCPSA